MRDALRRVFPAVHQARDRSRAAGRAARPVRPAIAWGRRSKADRDLQFDYLGLQTLYDRYFLHHDGRRFELPQAFFMRVAMGLALKEVDREERAIEFYEVLSTFDFMSSTPTLFNSGTRHSQLSSCYLYHGVGRPRRHLRGDQGERAAGQVRRRPRQRLDPGAGARLAHQGHERQEPGRGAVPEGGQRHGGRGQPGRQAQGRGVLLPRDVAPRHRGVPRTAQEHRRRPAAHARHEHGQLDSGPVHEAGDGRRRLDAVLALRTCPTCTTRPAGRSRRPTRATRRRRRAASSSSTRRSPRSQLWRKMLSMLFETGHPWITFKDACNLRSPAAARRHGAQLQPVHRDHAEHLGRARSRCATWARSTCRRT